MLDTSTLSLILVMVGFVAVAIVMVHHHNNTDLVRRKKGEVAAYTNKLTRKIQIVENEIETLKLKVDELNEEIDTIQT
jgi:peptidoglycan hydrolase CwlO-like protein